MKVLKLIFAIIVFGLFHLSFAQTKLQLDSIQWIYHAPENFKVKEKKYLVEFLGDNSPLLEVSKPEENHVNHLLVDYRESYNLKSLTLEIYVLSLVEHYKKSYNTDSFSAEVQMERKKIQNQVFYLIRSDILHKESNYKYVSDVYLTEINGKEFNVSITYDNDEDKMKLEESFFNSYFS